jgi:hypothetical protein
MTRSSDHFMLLNYNFPDILLNSLGVYLHGVGSSYKVDPKVGEREQMKDTKHI